MIILYQAQNNHLLRPISLSVLFISTLLLILIPQDALASYYTLPMDPDDYTQEVSFFDHTSPEFSSGDASALCESKCSLFAPVPGGIGPITIAVLLRNVVTLAGL